MSRLKIAIVDYDLGNTYSVKNALQYLGYKVDICSCQKKIEKSDFIILPGVGSFKRAMESIQRKNLDKILGELVIVKKKPILGICVGMQVLGDFSEEDGYCEGLGWINGAKVKKIDPIDDLTTPHVGWNSLNIKNASIGFSKIDASSHFYFDHSYAMNCQNSNVTSTSEYGGTKITASIQQENIFGVQFHPEKSQNAGLKLLRGLLERTEVLNA